MFEKTPIDGILKELKELKDFNGEEMSDVQWRTLLENLEKNKPSVSLNQQTKKRILEDIERRDTGEKRRFFNGWTLAFSGTFLAAAAALVVIFTALPPWDSGETVLMNPDTGNHVKSGKPLIRNFRLEQEEKDFSLHAEVAPHPHTKELCFYGAFQLNGTKPGEIVISLNEELMTDSGGPVSVPLSSERGHILIPLPLRESDAPVEAQSGTASVFLIPRADYDPETFYWGTISVKIGRKSRLYYINGITAPGFSTGALMYSADLFGE